MVCIMTLLMQVVIFRFEGEKLRLIGEIQKIENYFLIESIVFGIVEISINTYPPL